MTWTLVYTRQAQKDARKVAASGLKTKAQELLALIAEDPYRKPPPYEKLIGDLAGALSRRINIQHRLVYQVLEGQVLEGERVVKVLRLWSHYE
ncbi:Txe/YoeB family addiction module toxin [Alcanivorax sp. JB21]|uniref:Txe/YoeB family addiction module toxin n=1 Tax=Alcanivorax limicola TaxID=2874102 RepID=UPI001CBD1D02|nr:Txe/YoeB family addiction module toxin [Alcanivorax limicola]MBZ2188868.1 Txe/YoeB family addiction module toxin [Alcanivorax limicola]